MLNTGNPAEDLIPRWFEAFQGSDASALTRLVTFPFRHSRGDVVTVLGSEPDFIDWWIAYVAEIRAGGVVDRGEILRIRVDAVSSVVLIARLQSARLSSDGRIVAIVTTAFILYSIDGSWKVSATVGDAQMRNGDQDRPEPNEAETHGAARLTGELR